ncbi:MAG TPA: PqqD family peptide modification chaperone [Gemmatimonadaceae bacterium]|nr:PqqD family peptide modification chaperone [Gemmatimonadaceae bacterium]
MKVSLSSTVCRRSEPFAANVGGRVVLMSAEAGNYYDLDEVGSDIWDRLAQPVLVSDLCESLVASYDGTPDQIKRDVLVLLGELAAQELIDVRQPG